MPMSEVELEVLGLMENYGKQKRLEDAKRKYDAMVARNQRLNEEETYNPGVDVPEPITNVREVGPAGYQPGYQGGMDFANLLGMSPPPPTNKASSIVDASLDTGQQIARDQNRASTQGFFSDAREGVSSLLGGLGEALSSPFAQRILAIMARPEFQDPRGISAGIVGAAAGLKEDEKAAAKLQREEQRLANEAAQLQFLNKLKLAQAAREQRGLELKEEAAGKPKGTALPTSKEYIANVEKLVKRLGKDFISKESEFFGPSKSDIAKEITVEAMSLVASSGNTKTIRQAIEEVLAIRQGKAPSSTTTAPQSARPGVKERG